MTYFSPRVVRDSFSLRKRTGDRERFAYNLVSLSYASRDVVQEAMKATSGSVKEANRE